ncbi:MAG: RnfABCDGE type electron transport complex subunit B [Paramuribaculum sp.]|nr:RnfABCDGE type electron transport complex subunit B [Paramuribaculum sp.]
MTGIVLALMVLGGTGVIAALLLGVVSRRFAVHEDERIGEIENLLPGANCGGCGRSGCHDFAAACVSAGSLSGLECPVGGKDTMKAIAGVLGVEAGGSVPKIAVLKCAGGCSLRPRTAIYYGPASCAVVASIGCGESLCAFGCLGCGDCVKACCFGAISIDPDTRLAVVDEALCVGCGACVSSCPRGVIELRSKGPRGMRVWVACSNRDKGAAAMKECAAACIGCAKCERVCTHDAIKVAENLAYVDAEKCKLCRKCVDTCPTDALHKANFPESRINSKEAARK